MATIKFKPLGFNSEEVEKRAKEIGAVKKNTATSSNTIAGVDSSVTDKAYNSDFKESDNVKNAMSESGTALGNVKNLTSKGQLVSDDTWNSLGKQFSTPNSVRQADSYLNSQLQKIQSGKTSYSDQVRDMMDTIMGREKFTYDVDKDPLFQQALASAMGSGKTAMQDTIGQASALTGGYGSTYATSAANQAYNAFIEDAYDNLPQYYQMAMEAYQMEGDDLYRQLDMLVGADEREYSRNVTAYDATYQHRNQMYNEAYQQFRDAKNDAYNIANLKLSEHGQLVNDAYNYFNASADYANTLYEREYNKWADEVNQAMKWAEMLNSDWWKQYGYDFEAAEAQKDRDWKDTSREDEQAWSDANREDNQTWESTEAQNDRDLTISENAKYKKGSGSGDAIGDSIPDDIAKQASKITDSTALENFINNLEVDGRLTEEQGEYLYSLYEPTTTKPLNERDWTLVDKGGWNWGGGIDRNGKVSDGENEYTMEQLYNKLLGSMSADEAEAYIISLQKKFGISSMD